MREPGMPAASKHSLRAAIVVTGLCGITAQILLVREFLVTFDGNELTIGVILANWLLGEAIGAVLAGRLGRRTGRSLWPYVAVQLVFALSLPAALFAVRVMRSALGLTGESVGLAPVFWSSIVLLLPVSMSHGALFSLGVTIYSLLPGEKEGLGSDRSGAAAVGDVYLLETAGTVAGGALLSFLVLALLDALTSVIMASLAALMVCIVLCWSSRARALGAALGCVLVLGLAAALCGGGGWLYQASVRGQWPHLDVVSYSNSVYGNITVTRSGEQYSFFENGAPVITTPNPDIGFVEEFVHYPMLFHPAPRRVLVISGGAGGVLSEVQKYPVRTLDYCELDPALIEAVRRFPTPLTEREFSDPRTRISNVDGRLFLSRAAGPYDVILLGLPLPTDLQTGRFFTTDFFEIAKNKLADGGILALSVPGSITYLDESLAAVNLSILRGLRQTFPAVRVIANYTNFYLASKDRRILELGSEDLIKRMKEQGHPRRGLRVPFANDPHRKPGPVRARETGHYDREGAADGHVPAPGGDRAGMEQGADAQGAVPEGGPPARRLEGGRRPAVRVLHPGFRGRGGP